MWAMAGTLILNMFAVLVCGEVQVLNKNKGDSAVLPCVHKNNGEKVVGLGLYRKWLQPGKVMYLSNDNKPYFPNNEQRIDVEGTPESGQVIVSFAQLRGQDSDIYYCVFTLEGILYRNATSETEYFLHVSDKHLDVAGPPDVGLIKACAGGSATLPCLTPGGGTGPMEGVSLKRRRQGQNEAEVLFHSKRPLDVRTSSSPFPAERLHLGTVPSGLAYNLTLLHLKPEDSALYSCELLLPDKPHHSTTLGMQAYFVSVQDGNCQCSSYTTLLYTTFAAVGLLLLIVLLVLLMVYRGKARQRVKAQPQIDIYEEMVGVRPPNSKMGPYHLEETDASLYSNGGVKMENHYE
ncbi:cd7 antigen-like isoform X2 [Hypomesus transpacificus]|uniref:cd7 antigen-like isoform X2 n=1 Tax=Hypomesus transpacificus TaxID=137520 RepID=UPI001F088552|nr:cd7 antigen-like isoform X2 [Hypomesus transpacificus]